MKLFFLASALLSLSLINTGCGGGGGGDNPPAAPTSLSGVAAAGAPIIGTVTVKGALGNTTSSLIEANGNYDVDVTGLTAPYRLRAQGTVGGRTYKLHSYAVAADLGGNVNITPFTDLIIANAAQQIAESYFDSNTPQELDPADIDAQENELQAKLQNVLSAVGLDTAINLLNSTFSADHSGLDAALDLVRIEVDSATNIATITNLVENTSITDNVTTTGETDILTVTDAAALTAAVTDTQAIANIFDGLTAAFTNGVPSEQTIGNYFADDFLNNDAGKSAFLTQITTDPSLSNLSFSSITVNNLDATANTAEVIFNIKINGIIDPEPESFLVAKNTSGQWQIRGNQRIVETYFDYHCNDYDGNGSWPGACGINTRFWDEDFSNNGTNNAAIASGTVEIIDPATSTVKATVYLGTPPNGTAGDVQVYNEADGNYHDDWKEFGTATGQIDPAVFAVGDTIKYSLYTADLDTTIQASPAVIGTPVTSYTDVVLFVPEITYTKIPSATSATLTSMQDFTLGSNLTVAWTLANGTQNDEILLEIRDSAGNRIEIWDSITGLTANTKTFSSTQLDATTASNAGLLTTDITYNLKIRIYAADTQTGQSHSRDYDVSIPGPAAITDPGTDPNPLTCNFESGWDDINDQPSSFNSYDDFETVVADCGNALTGIVEADVVGTYTGTWTEPGVGTYVDTLVMNTGGTGTYTETLDSTIIENIPFNWTLVGDRVHVTVSGMILEVLAMLADGSMKAYSENADWTPASDLSIADPTAADGEIYTFGLIKQP